MLKCKDVAHLASEYLDQNTPAKINLQMRWHLMLCANCRRFLKHLQITNIVAVGLAQLDDNVNAEDVLERIKAREQ